MTTDERITARRALLTQQRAAVPPRSARPLSMTGEDSAAFDAEATRRDRQLVELNTAVAAVIALGSAAFDEQWLAHLTECRQVLVAERMQIKSPIRDPKVKGQEQNLALSIRCIDRGPDRTLEDSGYDLTTLRLGELMRASGYVEVLPPDPARNFTGQMPWFGAMPEVQKRITDLAAKRAQAEANLEAALMSDEERAAQEAASKQLRDAFNSLNVKHSPDALAEPCLIAYRNGEVWPLDEMTPLQRTAFEAADAAFRAEHRPRVAVTS